ncbi:hypothetical protein BDQ17DRAFT_1366402, partial [Cyathus striatus]
HLSKWADIVNNTPSLWTRIRVQALHQDEECIDESRTTNLTKKGKIRKKIKQEFSEYEYNEYEEEDGFDDYKESENAHEVAIVKAFTVEMITKWLSRSGNMPLDISIEIMEEGIVDSALDDVHGEWNTDNVKILSDIFRPFLPYAGRWRSLHLPLHNEILHPLSEIIASFQKISSHASTWPNLSGLTHCWSNLTRFVCNIPISVECVRAILMKCSSAVDMAFDSVSTEPVDLSDSPTNWDTIEYIPFDPVGQQEICLPHLQNLVICIQETEQYDDDSLDALHPVFHDLKTPSLRTLVIEEQFNPHVSFNALKEFIKKSKCTLKKLTLNGICEYESEGHSVQDLDSNLHALWTTLCNNTREFLPFMKTFHYKGPYHFILTNLVDMLQYRWYSHNPDTPCLERVILQMNYNFYKEPKVYPGVDCASNAEVITSIQNMIKEGMSVCITGIWKKGDVVGFCNRYDFDIYADDPYDTLMSHFGYVSRNSDPYWVD